MKQYPVQCEAPGCGKVVGTLELPDHQPLRDQHQGYLCGDCGQKAAAVRSSRPETPFGLSPEKAAEFEQLRSQMASKEKVDATDLDRLVAIFFQR